MYVEYTVTICVKSSAVKRFVPRMNVVSRMEEVSAAVKDGMGRTYIILVSFPDGLQRITKSGTGVPAEIENLVSSSLQNVW